MKIGFGALVKDGDVAALNDRENSVGMREGSCSSGICQMGNCEEQCGVGEQGADGGRRQAQPGVGTRAANAGCSRTGAMMMRWLTATRWRAGAGAWGRGGGGGTCPSLLGEAILLEVSAVPFSSERVKNGLQCAMGIGYWGAAWRRRRGSFSCKRCAALLSQTGNQSVTRLRGRPNGPTFMKSREFGKFSLNSHDDSDH